MMWHMELSDFGAKLSSHSGILQLMDDISKPLAEGVKPRPLGGGNPARVPQVEAAYRRQMERLLADGEAFEDLLAHYDSPQGRVSFLEMAARFFHIRYGWPLTADNIALTNGSQSAMFYLFNMFSGTTGGRRRTILFPLMPEYIGYADQGIEPDTFVSVPSKCTYYGDGTFKYTLDVDAAMAREHSIPLIVDNAYGLPFPDIVFTDDAQPLWNEDIVLSMSLSKIGLPSIRTGIVIAREDIIRAVGNINAIAALATGSFGPALAHDMLASGELVDLAHDVVRPLYQRKAERCAAIIRSAFKGTRYMLHRIEGSIFCWIYLPDLRIPTLEFYSVLMKDGVITVPGEYFFFGSDRQRHGLPYPHEHYDKCLRLNYSGDETLVEEGIRLIADRYREWSL